jgi:hypothetical protein
MLEFINRVIDNPVCFNRATLCAKRAVQRDCVARAGARMFEITAGDIGMATFTGQPEHANRPMTSARLSFTNDIAALDYAGLGFKHIPMIERLIMSSRYVRTPLPYIGNLLYFYGIGNAAGPLSPACQASASTLFKMHRVTQPGQG